MLWGERTADLGGRKLELMMFRNFLDALAGGEPQALIVQGSRGTGKTALLKRFVDEAESRGMHTVFVQAEKGEKEVELAVDAIGHLEEKHPHKIKLVSTLAEAGRMLADEAAEKETVAVIFVDDADRLHKASETVSRIVDGWRRLKISGAGLVVATGKELGDFGAEQMKLAGIEQMDAQDLVHRALKESEVKMSDECVNLILRDTGGNLRLFKTVCWYVYEMLKGNEKVITKGHYLAYLPSMMSLLSRESFGSIYYDTPEAERKVLGIIASKEEGMMVSDIAGALKKPLGQVTSLVKRLVERGEIVRVERGKYKVFSRLYGKYVGQKRGGN